MTYAITGASGQLAGLAAERLVQAVDPAQVVLISRDPAGLDRFAGTDRRHGDFSRPDTLPAAFAGVDTLLLVSTDAVGVRLADQQAAIAAAAAAGVSRILYTSVPRPSADNPAGVVPDHAGTELALRESGVAWTFLRNNLYADMQVDAVRQAAAAGRLVTNAGAGRTAYVTRADCAAAAVAAMVQDGHANRAYDITGPEAVSAADLAAFAARVSGAEVSVVDLDDAAYIAGLVSAGLPEPVADLLASFGAATRGGYLAEVSTAVHDLTGQAPTSLRTVLQPA
ncbi:NAD(P)H-binding protein [Nakamurella endophytica]|nr:NAD(P)H-binding protein [Nakamurella endophytica]